MNAVDTNILIYALDTSEATKSGMALRFLDGLSRKDTILPWQVICEFTSVLAKLESQGRCFVNTAVAVAAVRSRFPVVMPEPSMLDTALRLRQSHGTAFWDALMLAACVAAGVHRLYTEDVPGHKNPLGVDVINPLAPA